MASPSRPPMPRAARLVLWSTGALALLLLFAPALYVVKYYGGDRQREQARAATISLTRLQEPDINMVAPPLPPPSSGNAGVFYARALQSYAARTADTTSAPATPQEIQDVVAGGRCARCRFYDAKLPAFHDPQGGDVPYTFPTRPDANLHCLSAATRLAAGMAQSAQTDAQKAVVGRALLRFGDALGREHATRVHLAVGTAVQRMGVRLLLTSPFPALREYVDARQTFDEAVQDKYARLETATADNLPLQTRAAQHDADPLWRREAVWAASGTLRLPRFGWAHPLEAAGAKAALADVAAHDIDPSVRQAAAEALTRLVQAGGATFQR